MVSTSLIDRLALWTTDKDGIVLGLLAAEMTAVAGRDPGEIYRELADELGDPAYERIDAPATAEQKTLLKQLSPEQLKISSLGGEPITAMSTRAPGNDAPLGGLKVVTESGWFAVRPSGTEDVYSRPGRGTRKSEPPVMAISPGVLRSSWRERPRPF